MAAEADDVVDISPSRRPLKGKGEEPTEMNEGRYESIVR